jgi:hypothetical protein
MAADDAKDTSAIAPNASVVRQIIAVLRCDELVFQARPEVALRDLLLTPFSGVVGAAGHMTIETKR